MLLGAIEAGGTKMVCAVGCEDGAIQSRKAFPTLHPEETIPSILNYFAESGIEALGIGSFGPLCLDTQSANYGDITSTPKCGWENYPLLRSLREAMRLPVEIDTDVNAAALAEFTFGAARGLKSCLYVTVGTGIGGGMIVEGNVVHGMVHPEFGHLLMRPAKDDPAPDGFCPFHQGCLEGCASGPAIQKRWGVSAMELPESHAAWTVECEYLAQMCADAVVCLSPERIILGGGVMSQKHLFPRIRKRTQELLGGYVKTPLLEDKINDYIVAPGLGVNSGIVGALLLAKKALK